MTAQVEFFCSPSEERDVLRYLTKHPGTLVYDVTDGRMQLCDHFSVDDIPEPPASLLLYFHQPAHGDIIWHTTRPTVAGPTHGSLVQNLFAAEEWDKRGLTNNDKMVDSDLSPVLCYKRGVERDDRIGQNTVLAPSSSLNRVNPEYEKWVKRSLAWVRRRGTIIHDYRKQSDTIPNPYSIVNTIYALPDVLADVESNTHSFAILIDGGT
ncbi:MAG: hypothetical protein DWQ34_13505 [Planctomycetota bacterium]|nr:MAG: hypothetical protein DWQ29_23875 [Planctomycetota bacterium]REJ92239.1 MAG: hypothetical protein DWQ34_13505 [Planctomycetota bacterium]REK27360.1 MAG: hypothetical protein DWQ41_08335 [Planctomycetota bacterium]REK36618.1 MAG: hypothetical protein DWQ45_08295 [Planctomycetota bacterium]